ncbi:unnamed protein product [Mytilus coruscus]|uniref:Uncharacterized protein n=1 Tax=Mytilus coruscus TaxID=42192 RepID=A0A6J8AXJ9_MYTCO|nr:unnamed protein product [Mytilus coruscus]
MSMDTVIEFREHYKELSRDELDLVIKSELFTHRRLGDLTKAKKHKLKDMERPFQDFYFAGHVYVARLPALHRELKKEASCNCKDYAFKISNSEHLTEKEKSDLLDKYNEHVQLAKEQRDYYRRQCSMSKENYINFSDESQNLGNPPCSVDTEMHYSWDYAQQVYFPHHAQQVGPIYFKTPRKCNVFGMCSEGSGKQTFYLVDEEETKAKGANRLHKSIEYSMMIVGHTKFEPDWHFGVWKIADSVNKSSINGHNISQLVKGMEKPVIFYDWKKYLQQYFKTLKHISIYHHFTVDSTKPGYFLCKESCDSVPITVNLLKKNTIISTSTMPNTLTIKGLDAARQWFLYKQIREFCYNDANKDVICPKPTIAKTEVDLTSDVDTNKHKCPSRKQYLLN